MPLFNIKARKRSGNLDATLHDVLQGTLEPQVVPGAVTAAPKPPTVSSINIKYSFLEVIY